MLYDPSNADGIRQGLTLGGVEGYGIGFTCGDYRYETFTDCYPTHDTPVMIRGIEITLAEDVKPSLSVLGGSLLEPGLQSGLRTITYAASDQESGLSKVDMLLDDDVVAARDLSPRCTHIDFAACPATDEATLRVDTRVLSDGDHRLTLRATDAAGNQVLLLHPGLVQISNTGGSESSSPQSTASPTASQPQLSWRFARTSKRSLVVPFGQRVRISGRLSAAPELIGAGAELVVLERIGHNRERSSGIVRVHPDGEFTGLLVGSRPSRSLRLGYRTSSGVTYSDALRLRVRAASSLRTSLRGATLRFSGRVISRPIPARGKRVVLQGKAPGFAWAPFASLRTGRNGWFRGTYRLAVRRPGVRLQIRVLVPEERGYPYLGFASRPVSLRVR